MDLEIIVSSKATEDGRAVIEVSEYLFCPTISHPLLCTVSSKQLLGPQSNTSAMPMASVSPAHGFSPSNRALICS